MPSPSERPDILMQSIVRAKDQVPFVQLRWGQESGQLTVEGARQHARNILECAEAAMHDSAMVRYFVEKMGVDEEAAVRVMLGLREFRGDSTREDWRGE